MGDTLETIERGQTSQPADRMIGRAIRLIELVLGCVLLAAILLNFVNVVGRYLFARTLMGADEAQIYGMVWIAFVGAAVVAWRGEHLRMDALMQNLPVRVARHLRVIELVLVIVLSIFVVWQSLRYTYGMFDVTSAVSGIPMSIPHSAVAVGFALIALLCVRLLLNGRRP